MLTHPGRVAKGILRTTIRRESRGTRNRKNQMKHHSTQFGVRKNPDSERAHGLRLAMNPSSLKSERLSRNSQEDKSSSPTSPANEELNLSPPDATHGATRGDTRREGQLLTVQEVAELLRVPVSWVYGRTRKRSSERLPGYRLGKYWRFRANEVLAWVATQKSDIHAA